MKWFLACASSAITCILARMQAHIHASDARMICRLCYRRKENGILKRNFATIRFEFPARLYFRSAVNRF
jgi:hypothetical protein